MQYYKQLRIIKLKDKDCVVKWNSIGSDDVCSEEQAGLTVDKKGEKLKDAEGKCCPLGAPWPSWCWVELLFLATDSKQWNFVM